MTLKSFAMILVACIILTVAGCPKAPKPATVDFTDVPVFEDNVSPGPFPPADPIADAPPKAKANGYTGAVVYSNPDNCLPCRYLESDLEWLCENFGWSMSLYHAGVTADWIIEDRSRATGEIPRIVFYRGGKIIDTAHGYSSQPDFAMRQPALKSLVLRHPYSKH